MSEKNFVRRFEPSDLFFLSGEVNSASSMMDLRASSQPAFCLTQGRLVKIRGFPGAEFQSWPSFLVHFSPFFFFHGYPHDNSLLQQATNHSSSLCAGGALGGGVIF